MSAAWILHRMLIWNPPNHRLHLSNIVTDWCRCGLSFCTGEESWAEQAFPQPFVPLWLRYQPADRCCWWSRVEAEAGWHDMRALYTAVQTGAFVNGDVWGARPVCSFRCLLNNSVKVRPRSEREFRDAACEFKVKPVDSRTHQMEAVSTSARSAPCRRTS